MNTKEVMEFLNIGRTTLWRYVNKGFIEKIELPNGRVIFDEQSVIEFYNNMAVKNKKTMHIKISISNNADIENQCKILNHFYFLNGPELKDINLEITNDFDVNNFKEFFNNLDALVKSKINNITVTPSDDLNEKDLTSCCELLKEYNCKLVMLNKIEFDLSDINSILDKNKIEFFNINSIKCKKSNKTGN